MLHRSLPYLEGISASSKVTRPREIKCSPAGIRDTVPQNTNSEFKEPLVPGIGFPCFIGPLLTWKEPQRPPILLEGYLKEMGELLTECRL